MNTNKTIINLKEKSNNKTTKNLKEKFNYKTDVNLKEISIENRPQDYNFENLELENKLNIETDVVSNLDNKISAGNFIYYQIRLKNYEDFNSSISDAKIIITFPDEIIIDRKFLSYAQDLTNIDYKSNCFAGKINCKNIIFELEKYTGKNYYIVIKIFVSKNAKIGEIIKINNKFILNEKLLIEKNHKVKIVQSEFLAGLYQKAPKYCVDGEKIIYELFGFNQTKTNYTNVEIIDDIPNQIKLEKFFPGNFGIYGENYYPNYKYLLQYSLDDGRKYKNIDYFDYNYNQEYINVRNFTSKKITNLKWVFPLVPSQFTQYNQPILVGKVDLKLTPDCKNIINLLHLNIIKGEKILYSQTTKTNTFINELSEIEAKLYVHPEGLVYKNQILRYNLNIWSNFSNIKNPIIINLLPEKLEYIGNINIEYNSFFEEEKFINLIQNKNFKINITKNYNETSKTQIEIIFNDFIIEQKSYLSITFETKIKNDSKGNIENKILVGTKYFKKINCNTDLFFETNKIINVIEIHKKNDFLLQSEVSKKNGFETNLIEEKTLKQENILVEEKSLEQESILVEEKSLEQESILVEEKSLEQESILVEEKSLEQENILVKEKPLEQENILVEESILVERKSLEQENIFNNKNDSHEMNLIHKKLEINNNYATCSISGFVFVNETDFSNKTFRAGVLGIYVNLYKEDGQFTEKTVITNIEGFYIFENISYGKYFLTFGNLPPNYEFFTGTNIVNSFGKSLNIFEIESNNKNIKFNIGISKINNNYIINSNENSNFISNKNDLINCAQFSCIAEQFVRRSKVIILKNSVFVNGSIISFIRGTASILISEPGLFSVNFRLSAFKSEKNVQLRNKLVEIQLLVNRNYYTDTRVTSSFSSDFDEEIELSGCAIVNIENTINNSICLINDSKFDCNFKNLIITIIKIGDCKKY